MLVRLFSVCVCVCVWEGIYKSTAPLLLIDCTDTQDVVESLLLHWHSLALSSALSTTAAIWCVFFVDNPLLVTYTEPERLFVIRFHAQPAAVTQFSCFSSHRHCQCAQQTPPRNSRSRSFCSCVLPNKHPFRRTISLRLHEDIRDPQPPATLATQGKSRLLMPPRSSLLPSSSNDASSPKPSRRVLLHLPNPSTWVHLTVSAVLVATVVPFPSLAHSLTAHHLRILGSNDGHSWEFHTTSPSKQRPCNLIRNLLSLSPRQARHPHLPHRLPYSWRSVPPNWEHTQLVLQLTAKGVLLLSQREPTLLSVQTHMLVVSHSPNLSV